MTAINLLLKLESDIDLQGVPDVAGLLLRLGEIRKALEPKPKQKPKAKKSEPFKLEIVEGVACYDIYFDTEREVLAFLTKKQKDRKVKIELFLKSENLYFPKLDSYGGNYAERVEQYRKSCDCHLERIKSAGLNFEVKIIPPTNA